VIICNCGISVEFFINPTMLKAIHSDIIMKRLDSSLPRNAYCCTLDEVARELDLTKERCRQIQNIALGKCFAWCELHGYRFEDLIG